MKYSFTALRRRLLTAKMLTLAGIIMLPMLAACGRIATPPLGQPSFTAYQQQTEQWVRQHRAFQSDDIRQELRWNTPQETSPAGKPRKGVLLVHGLGDAPGTFSDVAPALAQQGYLVRTVLLAGHGTRPEDMIPISVDDWRQVVAEQAGQLQRDVDEVYLGGFSTGANLVLEYALEHPNIRGLLLFSPAIRSNSTFDFLTPVIAPFREWLLAPRPNAPTQLATRYLLVPTNGLAQYYRTSLAVRRLLWRYNYDRPVLMVVAEHDSVLDTPYLRQLFRTHFTHPASRLIWYGQPDNAITNREQVRADRLPEWHISQFSHMSVLFSPDNPLYGRNGSVILCRNGLNSPSDEQCRDRSRFWYSDWGYQEEGKTHVRLTFNPYFDWQNSVMQQVLADAAP
ncbi:putative lipoprotein [Dickeya chrysanthemi Ech1591]|uniref:Putative lipoprotein n=1 Tax=Dickeya chrysanthemi (strain Ech1591) TaxID=561229 RepID=C6CEN2_DICC1|nr:putative lipoprotein [Dickeya chrysanthemi Ech1591]